MAINTAKTWQFVDKSSQLITSHQRVEMLVNGRYYFEACAVQASIVEAMLHFCILTGGSLRSPAESIAISTNLDKLTLGGLIKRAQEHSLLDATLINELDAYKSKRNFVIHHHLVESHNFDYLSAIQEGDALIKHLFKLARQRIHTRLSSMGHKDADKFKD